MPTQISLHAVTRTYGDRTVLDAVTCTVAPGERAGIIGENGSGKSTLLRLLAGREKPDEGQVTVVATAGVGYLGQEAPLPTYLRVRQVIDGALAELRAIEARLRELEPLLADGDPRQLTEYGELATVFELRGGYQADARVARTLHALGLAGVDHDRRLDSLSGGEQARLHLAAVLAAGSEVLLLDEPTNHLSPGLVEELEAALADHPGALLVVSHDRRLRQRWRGEYRAMTDGRLHVPRSRFRGSRPEEGKAMRRDVPLSIQEIPVSESDAGPYGITAGPDGALWSTLVHAGKIVRLTVDGQVDSYPLDDPACGPSVITSGPDGALWFTRFRDHRIGRITARGEVTSYPVPTPDCGPYGITTGPDGALWFTEMNTDRIGRISTDGTVTEYPLPTSGGLPSAITAGPDGALWFTLNQANSIGRLGLDGVPALYPLPTPGAAPVGITAGSDGALWFVEIGAGQLGRITPDGRIQEFPLPDRAARPHAIIADPAGGCWFTEWGANRVGRVTVEGEIQGYDLPTPGSEPHGITVGPDGAVWVALEIGSIARLAS
ncbi:virginiamycin B lyase family protein [Plantactinospora soyae]|uniref:Virginiamycin B lyase n=1 Tax=Plantactinospora soyae TaxID=1544732 RepID=A0A927M662_9ACTN|nr:ATP-binding cassette domain-containing protein [Plantactinospora soyae]MBE1485185.1 streptogramin lyase/ABC-type cobalamin/Fe3+-siderophores transport system ATPase subunit [Plantactinospora soyae]